MSLLHALLVYVGTQGSNHGSATVPAIFERQQILLVLRLWVESADVLPSTRSTDIYVLFCRSKSAISG